MTLLQAEEGTYKIVQIDWDNQYLNKDIENKGFIAGSTITKIWPNKIVDTYHIIHKLSEDQMKLIHVEKK